MILNFLKTIRAILILGLIVIAAILAGNYLPPMIASLIIFLRESEQPVWVWCLTAAAPVLIALAVIEAVVRDR